MADVSLGPPPQAQYSIYDCLTDNPYSDGRSLFYGQQDEMNRIWTEVEDQEQFGWHQLCRVVRGDGTVTAAARCTNSADVESGGEFFSVDGVDYGDRIEKGLPMLDATYRLLIVHPLYKKNFTGPKRKNLYKYIVANYSCAKMGRTPLPYKREDKVITTAPVCFYAGRSENRIYGCKGWAAGASDEIDPKYRWAFVDPSLDSKDGQLNRKRIEQIIDKFLQKADRMREEKLPKIKLWPKCDSLDLVYGGGPPVSAPVVPTIHQENAYGVGGAEDGLKPVPVVEDEGEAVPAPVPVPVPAPKKPKAAAKSAVMKRPAAAAAGTQAPTPAAQPSVPVAAPRPSAAVATKDAGEAAERAARTEKARAAAAVAYEMRKRPAAAVGAAPDAPRAEASRPGPKPKKPRVDESGERDEKL